MLSMELTENSAVFTSEDGEWTVSVPDLPSLHFNNATSPKVAQLWRQLGAYEASRTRFHTFYWDTTMVRAIIERLAVQCQA